MQTFFLLAAYPVVTIFMKGGAAMGITLNALHWIYLIFILLILGFIVMRKDTSLICILGIFILGIAATASITQSVMGIFNSFIYAISELLGTILIISIIVGIVTTVTAFWLLRRDLKRGMLKVEDSDSKWKATVETAMENAAEAKLIAPSVKKLLALLVPLLFAIDIAIMYTAKLQGGDALGKITGHLIEGFQFGFRIFGPVIPIAAFFYLGDSAFTSLFGNVLPAGSAGLVNDPGVALANTVPLNAGIGAVTSTAVGAITGLDGSGFSGISLAGSIAKLFSVAIGSGVATLTALGKIAAIWVGGGTLIPWAVIPAAAICGVDPFELARRNLKPVAIGLVVTTIVAMFLI